MIYIYICIQDWSMRVKKLNGTKGSNTFGVVDLCTYTYAYTQPYT